MKVGLTEVYGAEADVLIAMSCDEKKLWIKENTPHADEQEIEQIVVSLRRGSDDECEGCKKQKNHAKNNQPASDAQQVSEPAAIGENKEEGNGTNITGRGTAGKRNKG